MQKGISFKTKGMQRDLAASAFNSEFAYENKNIRIITNEDNTLYSLVNEKGTKLVNINGIDSINGVVIGEATIDDELILFTADTTSDVKNKKDRIYKIKLNGEVEEVEGTIKAEYDFDKKWELKDMEDENDFSSKEKADKALNVNKEDLMKCK